MPSVITLKRSGVIRPPRCARRPNDTQGVPRWIVRSQARSPGTAPRLARRCFHVIRRPAATGQLHRGTSGRLSHLYPPVAADRWSPGRRLRPPAAGGSGRGRQVLVGWRPPARLVWPAATGHDRDAGSRSCPRIAVVSQDRGRVPGSRPGPRIAAGTQDQEADSMRAPRSVSVLTAVALLGFAGAGCARQVRAHGEIDPSATLSPSTSPSGSATPTPDPSTGTPTPTPTRTLDTQAERRITCLLITPSVSKAITDWNNYVDKKSGTKATVAASLTAS